MSDIGVIEVVFNYLTDVLAVGGISYLLEWVFPDVKTSPTLFDIWVDFFEGLFQFAIGIRFTNLTISFLNPEAQLNGIIYITSLMWFFFMMPNARQKILNFYNSIPRNLFAKE